MGNVFSTEPETKTSKLKKMINLLERHRKSITRRINRLGRELKVSEDRLKVSLKRQQQRDSNGHTKSVVFDITTQFAEEIRFKRSQCSALTEVLQSVNTMQQTVSGIYMTLHKRQMLSLISDGINRIDTQDIESLTTDDKNSEHEQLLTNLRNIDALKKSVREIYTVCSNVIRVHINNVFCAQADTTIANISSVDKETKTSDSVKLNCMIAL